MKNAFKSILSIFLALAIILCSASAGLAQVDFSNIFAVKSQAASSGTCGTNLKWSYNSGTLSITGSGYMTNYEHYSSEWYAPPWSSFRLSIKNIKINSGVLDIGEYAFYGCENLTSVTIAKSVFRIGKFAFANCSFLKSITIPNSITSIDLYAFSNCCYLSSVYISDLTSWCNIDFENGNANPLCCAGNLYINNQLATDIVIPSNITTIREYTFYGCGSLKSVIISDGVTNIRPYAFDSCATLTSVTISDSVTSIGSRAFDNCAALRSITIPASVTSIGTNAFGYYYHPTENQYIKNDKFEVNGYLGSAAETYAVKNGFSFGIIFNKPTNVSYLTYNLSDTGASYIVTACSENASGKIVVSNEYNNLPVTGIGDYAFYNCGSFVGITIPNSVKSIGDWAFAYCVSLTNLVIPDSVTYIGDVAFGACVSLESITIPDGVSTIGDSAFENCILLKSVTLPKSVTSIGASAFLDCESLTSATIYNCSADIGSYALGFCYDTETKTGRKIPNFIIKGYKGSTAETYAKEYGLEFVALSDSAEDGHNFTTWTQPATCTNTGVKTKICICGATITEIIPATGHKYATTWTVDKAATCTTQGSKSHHCTVCDDKINVTKIEALGHSYSGWVVVNEATCTTNGAEAKTCSACGDVVTQTISANGHTTVTDSAIAPTCTETGLTAGSHCSVCNAVIKAQATIPAKGHTEVKDAAVEATCTKEGKTEGSHCSVCNAVIQTQTTVPAKGHKPSIWETEKEATVYSAGKKVTKCTVCGKTVETATIAQRKCDKPTLKSIDNTQYGVKITWGKVKGGDAYAVYRKTSSGSYTKIATTENTYYTDKKAKSGTKYYYYVKAKNEAGLSPASSSKSILHLADPTLKSIANTKYGVKITWGKVSGAEKYYIYRKTSGGSYSKLATTKNAYYTDKTARSGKKYYYIVKAVKSTTTSAASNAKAIIYLADATLKTPSSTKSGVKLAWTKVTGAEGYVIYRKTGSGSYTKLKTEKGVSNLSYTDKSARKGKKYYYKVKAYKGSTYSAYSNSKTITDKY